MIWLMVFVIVLIVAGMGSVREQREGAEEVAYYGSEEGQRRERKVNAYDEPAPRFKVKPHYTVVGGVLVRSRRKWNGW